MYGVMYVFVFGFLLLPGPSCSNSDNIALLLGTLKMMQRASCDDEMVSLACPRGTAISIQVAQYGKATGEGRSCIAQASRGVDVEVVGEDCLWPNTMQYSLLQTVVEACQKKPQCKFSTKPKSGLVDPCPNTRKFVEVAYKCRPSTFRSRTCCEGDVIKLSCNPHSRIAVFEAQYGKTLFESISCPQKGLNNETCTTPHGTDIVMQICHGKRRCTVEANSKTFGTPCKSQSRTYLKVVYACVPLGVLMERYESAAENDEISKTDNNDDNFVDESEGASERWGEINPVSAVANPMPPPDEDFTTIASIEKIEETTVQPKKENESHSDYKVKLLVYVGAGLLLFIILILLLIAVRCYIIRKSSGDSKTGDMFTTEAPNVFGDANSDIDNDVDVSHISGTFYDPVHPDMILYREANGNRGTIRAMRPLSTIYPCAGASMYGNADYVPQAREVKYKSQEEEPESMVSPRSLGNFSNSQFYYG
ncbi:uncharacterized protein LOC128673816 [Plodia interpunctella]|uniref:uncharacterized protein LOC128673816 n=1 Tax=Plodia interpunctella TaxID=58824 RepID=UPI00236878A1|nr:uncharacterized protein LOC128673816 [Plodia interpunctella]